MAGYRGYSMSNNAVAAYANGEKPLSKWTKKEILEEVELCMIRHNCKFSFETMKKMPLGLMKDKLLVYSSWHHTSSHYNETNFYVFDEDYAARLTDKEILEMIKENKEISKKVNKKIETEEKWQCSFLEWSGSIKHPKATRIVEEGIIKGNWFYKKMVAKRILQLMDL